MKKHLNSLIDILSITLATGIVAIAVHFFMLPSHVSVGSMTGVAIVISNFVPFSMSSPRLKVGKGCLRLRRR